MADFIILKDLADSLNYANLTPDIDLSEIKVYQRSINRPAFQLTGYYQYFDEDRLQVLGMAETKFMQNVPPEQRKCIYERLFKFGFPAVVITRGLTPDNELLACAEKYRIPLLSSDETTDKVIVRIVQWINNQLAETKNMYGVFIDVYGEGILITGESGIGKSEAAVELIKRGHRLVADDLVVISKLSENILMGSAPNLTKHFVELRGIGVVDVKSLYGVESVKDISQLDMVINLQEWDGKTGYDRLGLEEEYETILGVQIVKHTVPIRPGRNLAIIIETAAVNNRQKKMGYNAAQALCERVSEEIRNKEAAGFGVDEK